MALFTFPLQTVIQEMCARIALHTGTGLASVIRKHYPKPVLYFCILLLFIANSITLGADLASPSEIDVPRIEESFTRKLEELADRFLAELEPLKEFILPGGDEVGAVLHLARTVARRAERRAVALFEIEQLNPETIVYLNRLSDLLFILARVVNHRSGIPEKMTDFSKRSP